MPGKQEPLGRIRFFFLYFGSKQFREHYFRAYCQAIIAKQEQCIWKWYASIHLLNCHLSGQISQLAYVSIKEQFWKKKPSVVVEDTV